jgi:hypothetical protein
VDKLQYSGDSDGNVVKWALNVAVLLQGSHQSIEMVKSCHVSAPVASLASSPTTSKLAAITKSSRCIQTTRYRVTYDATSLKDQMHMCWIYFFLFF